MNVDAYKLSVYFGDSLSAGAKLASDAIIDCFEEHELAVAALFRGIEGFGANKRIHAVRFPDLSEDLPILAWAVDSRRRILDALDGVDRAVGRGLITLERARLVTGEDVRTAAFPSGPGAAAKLTVYCGRGERSSGRVAYREIVDMLRQHGVSGATALMGVDGLYQGRRQRARLLRRSGSVPLAIISVGDAGALGRALPSLRELVPVPVATIERITVVKHDGRLLEPLPRIESQTDGEHGVWQTIRVYTRESALVEGRTLYTELTRRLRAAGAAGVTTIRGEWGFSSDEPPYGDRLFHPKSHVPTYTVYIDEPQRVAELWPIVDELTAEHGIVTSLFVRGYLERADGYQNGHLPWE